VVVTPLRVYGPSARRRWIAFLFFMLGALAIWVGLRRWSTSSFSRSCFAVGIGLGCVGLGVGIELAREWARRACGYLGAIVAAFLVWQTTVNIVMDFVRSPSWSLLPMIGLLILVFPALWTAVAIYCFLPSTRRHFAEVREHGARVRAAGAGDISRSIQA
jgi:hypothetical protein